jgi:hypothetical protein
MELEKEFKLGTQQVIELYNELTDFLDNNRNQLSSRDYPNIREFIENLEWAIQPLKNQVRNQMEGFLFENRELLNAVIKGSVKMGTPYEELHREWDQLSNNYFTLLENE